MKVDYKNIAINQCFEVLAIDGNADNFEKNRDKLAEYLTQLIQADFNKLIAILYRIDVSQEKVQKTLASSSNDKSQGMVLADLIIDRQTEKIKWREKYRR